MSAVELSEDVMWGHKEHKLGLEVPTDDVMSHYRPADDVVPQLTSIN